MAGKIDAAVRGTLPANATLTGTKRRRRVSTTLNVSPFLRRRAGKNSCFAPVGVLTRAGPSPDKLELVKKGRVIAPPFRPFREKWASSREAGSEMSVGIRRLIAAWPMPNLSQNWAMPCTTRSSSRTRSDTCGLIIAPDGISGNLIFRTLAFLGAGHGHGAPVVNIDRIFVDTSRASPDYTNALLLAASLLE